MKGINEYSAVNIVINNVKFLASLLCSGFGRWELTKPLKRNERIIYQFIFWYLSGDFFSDNVWDVQYWWAFRIVFHAELV